jgi:signal transduction histidine kinase
MLISEGRTRAAVEANLDRAGISTPLRATHRLTQGLRSPFATLSRVQGYVPALATFAAAIAVHWILLNVLGGAFFAGVMFLYVTAIVIGGWCGYGPGILIVLLVFLIPGYLFSPNYSLRSISLSAVGVSLLLSVMISRGAAWRRRSEAELQDTNEALEKRVQEKTAALAEANAALQRHNAELMRANADLEQFAYSASHDLQEPLRMVSVFAQLLKVKYADSLDAEGEEYIGHAVAGAKRLETLVSGLRSYLTITSIDVTRAPADTNIVVARCLENLKLLVESNGARCEVGNLPAVRLHEVHLEQLFQNLITNGIKYRSQHAPHIRISATKDDSNWVFSVQDNGIGIDPQYQDQIFGVFKRLHRNDEYEGTGIGLAICKRIVDRYGGRLWVESKPYQGATFLFTVPE